MPVRDQFHLVTWPFSKHLMFAVFFFGELTNLHKSSQIYRFSSHAGEFPHMVQGDGLGVPLIFVGKVSLKVERDTLHGFLSGINRTNQCECVLQNYVSHVQL